jgi:hypothetical protein
MAANRSCRTSRVSGPGDRGAGQAGDNRTALGPGGLMSVPRLAVVLSPAP